MFVHVYLRTYIRLFKSGHPHVYDISMERSLHAGRFVNSSFYAELVSTSTKKTSIAHSYPSRYVGFPNYLIEEGG